MTTVAGVEIRWLTAFLDVPADSVAPTVDHWCRFTRSKLSPWRDDAFATLLPADGDPHLRIQRTRDGSRGVHLDVHVPDIGAAAAEAEAVGASTEADLGHRIMRSPGGFRFCFVGHHGEGTVTSPVPGPAPNVVDQVSIDIPPDAFDAECSFWRDLTGWELRTGTLDEFAYLVRPAALPIRLLLQRLGADDPGPIRAHLDVACGDGRDAVAETHLAAGATLVRRERYWTTVVDPAGNEYCLTRRDPASGSLP